MNPTSAVDPTAPPPAPPPQPPRSSFSCDRHPTEQFTGFCPSCLCERLTTLDNSSSNTPSSSRRPSSASAAIKALFSSSNKANNLPPPPPPPKPSKPTSLFPELRRTKSFSASKNEALGLFFEPQRKSCDVRVRNTLCSLFSLEDDKKTGVVVIENQPSSGLASSSRQNPQSSIKVESCVASKPVFEETENEEDFKDPAYVEERGVDFLDNDDVDDEIRPVADSHLVDNNNFVEVELNGGEIVEEEEQFMSVNNLKPMKDHIDLDTREEKKSSGGGGFWAAASVFSKKWNKWRRKQKIKKQNNGENLATLPVEKPISRQYRETQSEIADYGFGRRSCDIDPRFSLDAGRISLDDPHYSFDEPRASWDGYLMGRRSFSRMAPPMVSVLEDAPAASHPHVSRTDMQIPLEETKIHNQDEGVPGGSVQTREYYSDSSSKRRKSLDRSSSIRKTAASVVAEIDELNMASNAKVSPPTTADYFHGAKLLVGERDLRDSNSNSLRDDASETFELGNVYRDNGHSVIGNGEIKESKKSSKRWSWRIWGFMQRRSNKDEDEDEKYNRVNGVERSYSESWQDLRREGNGDIRNGLPRSVFRSNSSVSWRNANHIGGSFGSVRNSGVEINGHNGKKRRDEFVLEKNRSARFSPSHTDNGLLRFYLTPLRGSRRMGMGKMKPNGNNTHSITRSVLRLY